MAKIETKELVTVRHYADMHGVTGVCVRKWIKKGSNKNGVVECVTIDGVMFIKLP